ncbi:hypothetical protein SK128_025703, partial [Halocaridina rubra]
SFTHCSTYKDHLRSHNDIRPYMCEVCHKSYTSKAILKRHTFLHLEEKPFKCNTCGKCYSAKYYLDCHALIHVNEKQKPTCKRCEKTFVYNQSLQRHCRIHCPQGNPQVCDICRMPCFDKLCKIVKYELTGDLKKYSVCRECFVKHKSVSNGNNIVASTNVASACNNSDEANKDECHLDEMNDSDDIDIKEESEDSLNKKDDDVKENSYLESSVKNTDNVQEILGLDADHDLEFFATKEEKYEDYSP